MNVESYKANFAIEASANTKNSVLGQQLLFLISDTIDKSCYVLLFFIHLSCSVVEEKRNLLSFTVYI